MSEPSPPFLRRPGGNLRGIAWMAAGAAVVSVLHVTVRGVSAEIDPAQIAFVRNLVSMAVMLPLVLRQDRAAWRTRRPGLTALRGMVGAGAMLTWFYALKLIPAGDATALSFTVVIFTTIGAALVLREDVGVRRWAAVAAGFAGTLIIVRPGIASVSPGALLAILSTVLWAAALIMVKLLSRTDSTVTIVFHSNVYFALWTALPAVLAWQWPTAAQWGWLLAIGVMASIGHGCIAQAMREGEATAVMPLDFTRLLWASLAGYVAFGEFPDAWTWIGGSVVFGAALYIARREARLRSRRPPTVPGAVGPVGADPDPDPQPPNRRDPDPRERASR